MSRNADRQGCSKREVRTAAAESKPIMVSTSGLISPLNRGQPAGTAFTVLNALSWARVGQPFAIASR